MTENFWFGLLEGQSYYQVGWGELWVEQGWWDKFRASVLGAVVLEMAIRLPSRQLEI